MKTDGLGIFSIGGVVLREWDRLSIIEGQASIDL
jgi:hypothetical protein